MMKTSLEIPTTPVMMTTIRDFRLSSRAGYVVNFKANTPTRVPPHVIEEALYIGAIVVEKIIVDAPGDKAIPGAAEAAVLEAEAKKEYIKQACLTLMARGDQTAFNVNGYPKFNKVLAECAPEAPTFTAGEVQAVYDDLRGLVQLAELE
jgi:hypothetical protein